MHDFFSFFEGQAAIMRRNRVKVLLINKYSTLVGLSKFKSAVVLICEVKATVDGMSLRFHFESVEGYNPQKHWYALKKEICGVRPTGFSKNEIFRRFPDERRSNAMRIS